jgi:riboflavin biosynthesis pyrimidine reductase
MVTSIDGSTVLDGQSGGLSSSADREVLLTLRSFADVIIVGAGTVRSEGYGIPRKVGQRIGVVSRSGNIDLTTDLFTSGAGFLIVPEDAPPCSVFSVRAGVGELDLGAALRALPGQPQFVQAEGGPALNGALASANLIDEINLTTSPLVIGGHGPRLLSGATSLSARYQLIHLLEDDGFLFSRYVRADSGLV